jgi:hypothetical protein
MGKGPTVQAAMPVLGAAAVVAAVLPVAALGLPRLFVVAAHQLQHT